MRFAISFCPRGLVLSIVLGACAGVAIADGQALPYGATSNTVRLHAYPEQAELDTGLVFKPVLSREFAPVFEAPMLARGLKRVLLDCEPVPGEPAGSTQVSAQVVGFEAWRGYRAQPAGSWPHECRPGPLASVVMHERPREGAQLLVYARHDVPAAMVSFYLARRVMGGLTDGEEPVAGLTSAQHAQNARMLADNAALGPAQGKTYSSASARMVR